MSGMGRALNIFILILLAARVLGMVLSAVVGIFIHILLVLALVAVVLKVMH